MNKQSPTTKSLSIPRLHPIVIALAAAGLMSVAHAAPQDGIVRAGDAKISSGGTSTRIDQSSSRAIIDWRGFSIGAGEQVQFVQPSVSSATLNRVTGAQVSTLLGKLDANGQVLLINPNGIIIGRGAQINVGSLIASTSNISNDNFMSGRLIFDTPGKPGAGILNAGSITAAEGGLVALVAPHVRNDGLIQARLGKVLLGAADTFTIDLYGDQLVNLALSDIHVGQLRDVYGQPVQSLITQNGRIESGQAVLITAATARNVLDNLINMSGTIKAETAVQDGGRIMLLGEGGKVAVSGSLDAQGNRGGQIDVLGGDITLASAATLNASGSNGGGTIHVGGAWQGSSTTYRAQSTTVETGANLTANAVQSGNGGEIVVWSDGHTNFAGAVEAKGGAASGDGGRMEVSGKNTLAFNGTADASAMNGAGGSLLLDPAYLNIGLTEASLVNRVLRSGTTTTLQADIDINVNAVIDGRGGVAGGGLTMNAGNNININDFVVTNNGAMNLTTGGGTLNIAAGKAMFAGTAPITVSTGGNLSTGPLLTSGSLSLASRSGSVAVNSLIDAGTGPVSISAGGDVDINQPIISLANGNPLNISAGNDLRVNAQIDGRDGTAGGAANLTAGHNVGVNNYILTNNGAININAAGSIAMGPSTALFSGTAPISVIGVENVTTSPLLSTGAITARSSAGTLIFGGSLMDGTGGPLTLSAAGAVDINQPIVNARSDAPLSVTAGSNINVNAQIDGRDGNVATLGGAVILTAGQNIVLNQSVITDNANATLTAQNGTLTTAANKGIFAGSGSISLITGSSVTTSTMVTTGPLSVRSTGGSITMNTPFTDPAAPVGALTFNAAQSVDINQPIANTRSDAPLNITAGATINVNAPIDGRDANAASPSGSVTMTAGQSINVNQSIITENAPLALTVTAGTINTAPTAGLFSGSGPLSVTSGATLVTGTLSTTGALGIRSTAGGVNIATPIADTVGAVTVNAATTVNVNQPITNLKSGNNLSITAGTDINVNAQIDGRSGALPGGSVTLTAGNNLNVNEHITTNDGAANLTATNGSVVLAPTKQVSTGSAPITIVSGSDFSTGAAPLAIPDPGAPLGAAGSQYVKDFLKQYVTLVTTGQLNITSTNGNIKVDAPISDMTGPVILSGMGIVVNQHVNSNNQPITLNAGTSGITVNPVDDSCGSGNCPIGAPQIDARDANLTLNSIGDITIHDNGVATTKTLSIDTRGQLTGRIAKSISGAGIPEIVTLVADKGIPFFATTLSNIPDISVLSANGSVDVFFFSPAKLRVTTGCAICNIAVSQFMGEDVLLNAGGDINLPSQAAGGKVVLIAGNDINMTGGSQSVDGALLARQVTMNAGRNVNFPSDPFSNLWIGAYAPSAMPVGPLSITAGQDIVTTPTSGIHLENGQNLTLTAGRNIILNALEMFGNGTQRGSVTMTATNGSITTNNPLGANLVDGATLITSDPGINELTMLAPAAAGSITMQGARAQGNIFIFAGNTINSTYSVTSISGSAFLILGVGGTGVTVGASAAPDQQILAPPGQTSPVIGAGPTVPPPNAPGLASVGAPGLPAFPDIFVLGPPGAGGGSVGLPGSPLAAVVGLPAAEGGESGTDTSNAQRAAQQQSGSNEDANSDSSAIIVADGGTMVFTGGRGLPSLQGLSNVPCPPGVASGTAVQTKNASGQVQTAACK